MTVRIKITKPGIFGAVTNERPNGEVPVGTEMTLEKEPKAWAGRYEVIGGDTEGKELQTGDQKQPQETDAERAAREKREREARENGELKAVHRGGGSWSIMRGDTEVVEKMTKEEATTFNGMSDDDKKAYVDLKKEEAAK